MGPAGRDLDAATGVPSDPVGVSVAIVDVWTAGAETDVVPIMQGTVPSPIDTVDMLGLKDWVGSFDRYVKGSNESGVSIIPQLTALVPSTGGKLTI